MSLALLVQKLFGKEYILTKSGYFDLRTSEGLFIDAFSKEPVFRFQMRLKTISCFFGSNLAIMVPKLRVDFGKFC